MKNTSILFILLVSMFQATFAQINTKLDPDYSKIDFYLDSIYGVKFKQYMDEKNKVEVDGLYKRIDQAIANAATVKTLEITNSSVTELPKGFEKLVALEKIQFRNCKKLDLNKTFKQLASLPNLKDLEVSFSSKYAIPENISALVSLENLNLEGNKFVTLPESFSDLKNLKSLKLSQNAVINEDILFVLLSKMPNLKTLKADYCQIRSVPNTNIYIQDISLKGNLLKTLPLNMVNANSIDLSSNTLLELESLFEFLSKSKTLKSLHLDYSKINLLPANIGTLKSLETLSLVGNNLTEIPTEIGNLSNLKQLDFSNEDEYLRTNKITSVPASIGKLANLKSFKIRANALTSLPKDFGKLSKLEVLDLHLNILKTFPAAITNLTALKVLDLGLTEVTNIPTEIGNLVNLEYLDLSGNFFINYKLKIKEIPENIGKLVQLKTLIFRDNVIETLPESFGSLTQLEVLDLKNNLFATLPESFGNLNNLKELNVKANEIKTLPNSFANLKRLELLNIAFNFNIDAANVKQTIGKVSSLKLVDISDCYLDEATVNAMRTQLPNTTFKAVNLVKK